MDVDVVVEGDVKEVITVSVCVFKAAVVGNNSLLAVDVVLISPVVDFIDYKTGVTVGGFTSAIEIVFPLEISIFSCNSVTVSIRV